MPFNVWCTKCGEMIGKGVRFNAEKKQVGMYHSTKIWSFIMKHHCGNQIEIHTDPRKTEYRIIQGIRRKVESYKAEDAQVIEIGNRDTSSLDVLSAFEQKELNRKKAKAEHQRLSVMKSDYDFLAKNDAKLNQMLRNKLRPERKDEKTRTQKRKAMGLPDHVQLLPETEEDKLAAKSIPFGHKSRSKSHRETRRQILRSSIFDKKGHSFKGEKLRSMRHR
eukprot:g7146.t1